MTSTAPGRWGVRSERFRRPGGRARGARAPSRGRCVVRRLLCTGRWPAGLNRARLAWAYGFAISGRDADKALAAFNASLRHVPHNFQALYGLAMLAMSEGKNDDAIRGFEQALAVDPGRVEARRYRAIVLARQGQWERATQEVNWCLEQEPRSAATLYAAACVVARAFDHSGTNSVSGQALDLLERALAAGADPTKANEDPDLAAIRRLPRFQHLVSKAPRAAAVDKSKPGR